MKNLFEYRVRIFEGLLCVAVRVCTDRADLAEFILAESKKMKPNTKIEIEYIGEE